MNASGNMPKNIRQKWQFAIEINGFNAALFSKGKPPTTEFEESAFNPAGSMFPLKSPGRVKFEDIVLEKGRLADGADSAAIDWLTRQADLANGTGLQPDTFMRDVDFIEFNRAGEEMHRWTLHGAFIKKYEQDESEGGSSDGITEKLTLCYQYWTKA